MPLGPTDPLDPKVEVTISTPAIDGVTLSKPRIGEAEPVEGTVKLSEVSGTSGTVKINIIIKQPSFPDETMQMVKSVTIGVAAAWRSDVMFRHPGDATIEVFATYGGVDDEKKYRLVTIEDNPKPELTPSFPTPDQMIEMPDTGTTLYPSVKTTNSVYLKRVECSLDNWATQQGLLAPGDKSTWTAIINFPPYAPKAYTLNFRGFDYFDSPSEITVNFQVYDGTPPTVQITKPAADDEVIVLPTLPGSYEAEGTVYDRQTGLKSIEWSLDGQNFNDITPDAEGNWKTTIAFKDWGFYALTIRVKDNSDASHSPTKDYFRQFTVVSTYKSESLDQLLSPRSYLAALLEFTRDHVRKPASLENDPGPQMDTAELTRAFYQPFGKLPESSITIGDELINRLRIPIEVLRAYSSEPQQHPMLLAHWRCDEGSGDQLTDSSSYHHSGTLKNGAGWGAGRLAGAVILDGSNYVEIPGNSAVLELGKENADFSVAFWFCLKEGPTGKWRGIIRKGNVDNLGGPGSERTFALWMAESEKKITYSITTEKTSNVWNNSTAEVTLNAWTHVAYVKVGDCVKLYLDGRLDSVKKLDSKTLSNTGPIYIGKNPWCDSVNAGLDDIRIYGFALSDQTLDFLAQSRPDDVLPNSAADESTYLKNAYEAILSQVGTSYTELRVIKAADTKKREALASRLGIRLDPATPDRLEQLLPPDGGITEEWLEKTFGLRDTKRDPATTLSELPKLLQWQQEELKRRWDEEDHPPLSNQEYTPIIDPDLIDFRDLKEPFQGKPAYELFTKREKELSDTYTEIDQKRQSATPPIEAFDTVTKFVLGDSVDLPALVQRQKNGEQIASDLKALHLTVVAFQRMMHIRTMAEKDKVTKAEWEDVCNILVQARKEQGYENWKNLERSIVLSDEHFVPSNEQVALKPWRASYPARFAWQSKLKDRMLQWDSLGRSLRASISAAEEFALPTLRDTLLTALADQDVIAQVADDLTKRLLVDILHQGSGQTSRIMQAAETLQEVVYSVRIKRFSGHHPAASWEIEEWESDVRKGLELFDDESGWAAMPTGGLHAWCSFIPRILFIQNCGLPLRTRKLARNTKI